MFKKGDQALLKVTIDTLMEPGSPIYFDGEPYHAVTFLQYSGSPSGPDHLRVYVSVESLVECPTDWTTVKRGTVVRFRRNVATPWCEGMFLEYNPNRSDHPFVVAFTDDDMDGWTVREFKIVELVE